MASDYSMICRLCLTVKQDLINIGSIMMLYERIMQLINVPLFDGDGLPSNVCSGCCKRITEFFKFREACQSNFYILQKYHLLPRKSQNVLDFISTHTRFQEHDIISNRINSTFSQAESNNENSINVFQNNNIRENSSSASCRKDISINHTIRGQTQEQNNSSKNNLETVCGSANNAHELNLNESINIKRETALDHFIEISQVESLSCTPDIFQDLGMESSSSFRECLSEIEMVRIPEQDLENYSSDEDESNTIQCEPMFKRIKLPANITIRECKVVLEDCVKSKTWTKENITKNKIGEKSLTIFKNKDRSSERRMSYCNPFSDRPDPLMINRKITPDKVSSSRNSFPLNNKFVCSLCQKTFMTSEMFREHIKFHTLKRVFDMTKSNNNGYKFTKPQYLKTK